MAPGIAYAPLLNNTSSWDLVFSFTKLTAQFIDSSLSKSKGKLSIPNFVKKVQSVLDLHVAKTLHPLLWRVMATSLPIPLEHPVIRIFFVFVFKPIN